MKNSPKLPNKQLNKIALFTDYHVGKTRDLFYTTTTLDYMEWFCSLVKQDPTIDCIGFLGDWHESRNSIYIDTLNISNQLITKLNDLGLPIFFVVGNHDLATRHTRDIHSCVFFERFENVIVIDQPTIYPHFSGSALFSPYLFHTEYEFCLTKQPVRHLLGHFEFKDFVITGYNIKMEHGPDADELKEYDTILSGHFHKRQKQSNVQYIGNTFCTSFADANDVERGACVYQFDTKTTTYHNWNGGPRFVKTTLTQLAEGRLTAPINDKTFIRCIADVEISYEEHTQLKQEFIKRYGVRSVLIEEDKQAVKERISEALPGIGEEELANSTVDELVHKMLSNVQIENIDNTLLTDIYKSLT